MTQAGNPGQAGQAIESDKRERAPTGVAGDVTHRRRVAGLLVVVPLVLAALALWSSLIAFEGLLEQRPAGIGFGGDFAMFIAAAQVTRDGGNPYDYPRLFATEHSLLSRQGLPMVDNPRVVRVGNPPLFFWVLQPLTRLSFTQAALTWMVGMYLMAAIGFLACLSYLGWKHWPLPLLTFLLLPQVVLGAAYGNVEGLVFAAIAGALAIERRYPCLAGILLVFAWLKPQVALPVVMLIVLFLTRDRRSLLTGFFAATLGMLGLTAVATGWMSLGHWIEGVLSYPAASTIQLNLASLAGLYVGWAPALVRVVLEGLSLFGAVGLNGIAFWRLRRWVPVPTLAIAWLWLAWFLATPYAHFPDEILLVIPIMAVLGQDAERVYQLLPALALYLFFFSFFLLPTLPHQINLLSLILVVILAILVRRGKLLALSL